MSSSNYNIHVEGEDCVVRTGEAPQVIIAQRVEYTGQITAPADWLEQKIKAGYDFDLSDCHCTVDRSKMAITFITNEEGEEPGGFTISGKVNPYAELERFGINSGKTYTATQLADLLKFNRILFSDPEQCFSVIGKLQNFRSKVVQDLEKIDNQAGSKRILFEQKLNSEFDAKFTLGIPIYEGGEPRKFEVIIRFDVRDSQVSFWLESVELKELADGAAFAMINAEVDRMKSASVPTIFL